MKMKSKALAILISLAMVFTLIPMMGTTVYADDPAPPAPGIAQGPDVLSIGSNTSGAATVYMAGEKWRVIGYAGEGVASTKADPEVADSTDTMSLIAAGNLKNMAFRNDISADGVNHYGKNSQNEDSDLKKEVEAVANTFTEGEKGCIVARTLEGGNENSEQIGYDPDKIKGEKVEGAFLWPLSNQEANTMDASLRSVDTAEQNGMWWLRTPGKYNKSAGYVSKDGTIYASGRGCGMNANLRPAFNVDLKSVSLTSSASGGKSADVGSGSLTTVGTNDVLEWKLTLKDEAHENFKVKSVMTGDGKTLTIKYSGAAADGVKEYISAIIKDKDDNVKFYGKLALASGEDETEVTVNTDGKMQDGDTLYIFNEQCNGDYETDFSSPLQKITLPHKHDWNYTAEGDTVTAKCGYPGCGQEASAKLVVSDKVYDGKPAEVTVEKSDNWTEENGLIEPMMEYSILYENGGGSLTTKPPKVVCECTAILDIWKSQPNGGGWSICKVKKRFKITEQAITFTAENKDCRDLDKDDPLTFVMDEEKSWHETEAPDIAFKVTDGGGNPVDPKTAPAGKYTITPSWAEGKENSNYAATFKTGEFITAHDISKKDRTEPTCTEDGAEEHYECSVCSKYFSDEQGTHEIPKSGKAIPAIDHKYGDWTNFDADQHQRVCEHDAGHVEKENHKWDAGTETKPATTTETGIRTFTCETCKATKTEAIPKLDKKANPLTVKGKTATVKSKKLKKKSQTISRAKAITVSGAQGALTYQKASVTYTKAKSVKMSKKALKSYKKKAAKKITINSKTGKVTLKKGLKKGTYKVKVKVKAAGNANYEASTWKATTVKIKVK